MTMSDTASTTARARSRRQLLSVFVMFFAPLVVAFIVYYGLDWRPDGRTNKGELISPAIPLPATVLPTPAGKTTDATFLQNKWTLLYMTNGDCTQVCRDSLLNTRQVRLLLGKDMTRVQRVFLYRGACCDAAYFDKEQQGLLLASVDTPDGQLLLDKFPSSDGVAAMDAQRIYIVDPLGNLLMSYAPHADARDLLSDIKKLLKLSHIG